jgi:hypothetical protein
MKHDRPAEGSFDHGHANHARRAAESPRENEHPPRTIRPAEGADRLPQNAGWANGEVGEEDHRDGRGPVKNPNEGADRRKCGDRRERLGRIEDGAEASGLERRRGRGRRLADSLRAAEFGELNKEQFLFVMAVDAFKKANGVAFPAWSDVIEIVRLLGYRKTCKSQIELRSAEDWTERADADSNVRPKGFERRIRPAA